MTVNPIGVPIQQSLVLVGIGLIGVHVLDDNFLQPQPGTSARGHLVSGLVPLLLLGLVALVYGGVRAGAQAAIGLGVGVFGIVAGIESGYYGVNGRLSGDDYTGLISIVAGLMLLGRGAVTLWRSRRLDDRRLRRYARRALIGLGCALLLVCVVFPLGAAYVITHVGRLPDGSVDLGPDAEVVTLETRDGLELAGTYIPSRNGAAVIVFPGRAGPQAHARMLARHGYGVLLFDQRGDGDSQGDPNGFGWSGEQDVMAAIAFLQGRAEVDPGRIGGLGLSVAGELLLQTAAHTDDLEAVVSEGAGTRWVGEDVGAASTKKLLLPVTAMIGVGTAVFGNAPPPAHLDDLVGRIAPRSIFLIYTPHGVDTEALNPAYFRAAGEPKAIWAIPEAGHTEGLTARPEAYERRVIEFFAEAMPAPAIHLDR